MAQNQLGSRLIQPTASSSRGLSWPRSLGWAYPGHGLPWTWKCSLMHSIVVRDFAEEVNKCCACSLFNYVPDLHSRETHAVVAGKWSASRESLACSRRSDSGERCEVKRSAKKAFFTSHRSPLSERLEQARESRKYCLNSTSSIC